MYICFLHVIAGRPFRISVSQHSASKQQTPAVCLEQKLNLPGKWKHKNRDTLTSGKIAKLTQEAPYRERQRERARQHTLRLRCLQARQAAVCSAWAGAPRTKSIIKINEQHGQNLCGTTGSTNGRRCDAKRCDAKTDVELAKDAPGFKQKSCRPPNKTRGKTKCYRPARPVWGFMLTRPDVIDTNSLSNPRSSPQKRERIQAALWHHDIHTFRGAEEENTRPSKIGTDLRRNEEPFIFANWTDSTPVALLMLLPVHLPTERNGPGKKSKR